MQAFYIAINGALSSGQPGLMIEAYLELAEVLVEQGRADKALEELAEGLLLSTKGEGELAGDGPPGLWRLLLRLAELGDQRGDRAARRLAERALFHALRERSTAGQARCNLLLDRLQAAGEELAPARRNRTAAH